MKFLKPILNHEARPPNAGIIPCANPVFQNYQNNINFKN